MVRCIACAVLPLLVMVAPLSAQQERGTCRDSASVAAGELPELVAKAVADFYNDPRRERYEGPLRVDSGDVLSSDIAVLEGDLKVAGRVEGSIVVVNGDVVLEPGGAVTGDLLVVGGTVESRDRAGVGGEVYAYPERLSYRREGKRIAALTAPEALQDTAAEECARTPLPQP